jgi:predicted adenylyl cyclase CyaB
MTEIEIKIQIENRDALIQKVESLGGQKIVQDEGIVFDIMYDDKDNNFILGNKIGKHLRLRKAPYGNRLTYKEMLSEKMHTNLLERTEIEVSVSDFEKTDLILKNLGFVQVATKEKYVLDYKLDGFVLEFHRLPFLGDFLEIEASENDLEQIVPKLGFQMSQGINQGYSMIFSEYCRKNNLSQDTPLTFETEKKILQLK